MQRYGRSVSRVVGLALGAVLFEAVRRQLRADTWDYGHAEAPVEHQGDRVVVPVTLSSDELDAVARRAEASGTSAAQFIRDAALARARQ